MNILLELSNMYIKNNSRIQLIPTINLACESSILDCLFNLQSNIKNDFCENRITSRACRYLFC